MNRAIFSLTAFFACAPAFADAAPLPNGNRDVKRAIALYQNPETSSMELYGSAQTLS